MYKRTVNRDHALANGYIGEIDMRPTIIAEKVGRILGKKYKHFTIYFYGTPDERLRKKFNYDLSKPKTPGIFHPANENVKQSIKEGMIK